MQQHNNIFPVFDKILQRSQKEVLLNQRAKAIWLTGLSGSGKTTIAIALELALYKKGYITQVLDADNVRTGISNNLTFSPEDRAENIRRIAEVTKLFLHCGIITINCFISPRQEIRNYAKEIIGQDDFVEVYVNAPLHVCENRDVKGLYKKARAGELSDFTGISAPFEPPGKPDIEIKTDELNVMECVSRILEYIEPLISIVNNQ